MLGVVSAERLDAIRATVGRHGTPEDLEDLEQLVIQGRLEQATDG